jgi:hypothetical protein
MYADRRVFAAAPPLYVVALLIQLWWIPVGFLQVAGWDGWAIHRRELSSAMSLVTMLLLVAASWELVRRSRSRSRVRIGMVVTFAANLIGLAIQLIWIYGLTSSEANIAVFETLGWATMVVGMLGVFGLAVAAGRRSLGTSLIVIALTAVAVSPLRFVIGAIAGAEFAYWFQMAVAPVRVVLALIVIGAIAKQCYEPIRDHLRASRRFSLLVWLFAARAAFSCVVVVVGRSTIIVQLWLIGVETVMLSLVAVITWGIAQSQLPRMPRYALHLAMAGALVALFLITQIFVAVFALRIRDWYGNGHYIAIESWQVAPAAIANGFFVVALWRYAKHARAIRRSVIGGAIVVAAATAFELFGSEMATWVCEVIACAALIPAFRATALALADDPVPTTADVFA